MPCATPFRVATSGKMGPVLLDIPRDLLPGADLELELLPPDAYRVGQTRARGDLGLIQRAADVLVSAQRPVILAGGGVQWSNAGDDVCRLAEMTGAAIVTFLWTGRRRSFRPPPTSWDTWGGWVLQRGSRLSGRPT